MLRTGCAVFNGEIYALSRALLYNIIYLWLSLKVLAGVTYKTKPLLLLLRRILGRLSVRDLICRNWCSLFP